MSATTHSNIDASAQRTHDTIDAAAQGAHNLASSHPIDRTAEAGHNASIRAQQTAQDASYRTQQTAQDAGYRAQDATYRAADKASNVADQASVKTQQAADQTRQAASNAADQTRQAASNAADRTRDAASNAADQTRNVAANAADRTKEAANTASAKTQEALAQAQENARRLSTATSQRVHQLADSAMQNPLVQQTSEASKQQLNALDRELAKYGFLNEFEARTGVSKTYGVLGAGGVAALLILGNPFNLAMPLTNAIGWVLPTYLSCRALESPQSGDDKQWLTYWIIFGLLNLLESSALRVILYYIPQYFTFKLAFLIWLLYPGQQNAQKVYHSLVRPLFQTGRAKAQAVNSSSSTGYGRTNTLSSPGSANFVNSSTGFSSAGTTADSTGYSTATNPFATSGGAGMGGLHATSAGNAAVVIPVVPSGAGYAL